MATLADLNVVIGAQIDDFEAKMGKVQQGIGRVGDYAKQAGQSLSTYVTLPLTLLAGAAIKTAADLQALETGFAATYKGAEPLSVALAKVRDLAKLPGLGLREALEGATNLQAAGFSADQARASLQAFGNALATVGKGKAELDKVSLALTQINNTPFVQGQDLNQLRQALPQIGEAMKKAFGVTNAEGLKALGITSKEFITTITQEFAKLPPVTGGLKNALENLSDSGTLALGHLGDALNKSFNLQGLSDSISSAVASTVKAFDALDPAVQKVVFGVGIAAAAAGPLLFGLGSIAAAIPSVVAGLEILGVTSTLALGPIGIGVAAVAAGAYLIISHWDELKTYFSTGEGGRVFGDLASSITSSVGEIVGAFKALNGGGDFSDLVSATGILKALVRDVAVGFTALSDIVGGVIGGIARLLKGDFAGALDQAKRAAYGLIDPIANVLGFSKAKNLTATEFFTLNGVLKDVATTAGQAAAGLENAAKKAGLLADLEARLKAVKDRKPDDTTTADIARDNQLIASLEAQIKKLNELGVGSQEGQKALEALRKELAQNGQQSELLGTQYDFIGERQKILTKGVQDLLDKGFSPASSIVRAYATELKGLNDILGDNARLTAGAIDGLNKLEEPGDKNGLGKKIEKNPLTGGAKDLFDIPKTLPLPAFDSSALQAQVDKLTLIYQGLSPAQKDALQAATDFNTGLESILVSGMAQIASGFGEAIGNIITGAQGLDALPAVVLGALGGLAIQVGQLAIGTGIAVGGIKAALESLNPVVAIAGGIALVALGTAVKGAAKNIGAGGSAKLPSGGGGLASAPRTPSFTPTPPPTAAAAQVTNVHQVEFKLEGNKLVGLLQIATDQRGKVVARRG